VDRAVRDTVTITYLELLPEAEIREPSRPAPPGFRVSEVRDPAVNADLYRRVGADYAWFDRLRWSDADWRCWADRVHTYVIELGPETAGYWELEHESETSAKIPIFGLLGEFHGRGIGGHALSAALRIGREFAPRVWLTTCTLDGPYALRNYLARGMSPFREETAALPASWARAAG
jgi:GNAT superfamily N-acetyltransferase